MLKPTQSIQDLEGSYMQGESIINDTANYVLYYILYHIYMYNINTPFFYTVFNGVGLRYKQLEDDYS